MLLASQLPPLHTIVVSIRYSPLQHLLYAIYLHYLVLERSRSALVSLVHERNMIGMPSVDLEASVLARDTQYKDDVFSNQSHPGTIPASDIEEKDVEVAENAVLDGPRIIFDVFASSIGTSRIDAIPSGWMRRSLDVFQNISTLSDHPV